MALGGIAQPTAAADWAGGYDRRKSRAGAVPARRLNGLYVMQQARTTTSSHLAAVKHRAAVAPPLRIRLLLSLLAGVLSTAGCMFSSGPEHMEEIYRAAADGGQHPSALRLPPLPAKRTWWITDIATWPTGAKVQHVGMVGLRRFAVITLPAREFEEFSAQEELRNKKWENGLPVGGFGPVDAAWWTPTRGRKFVWRMLTVPGEGAMMVVNKDNPELYVLYVLQWNV